MVIRFQQTTFLLRQQYWGLAGGGDRAILGGLGVEA